MRSGVSRDDFSDPALVVAVERDRRQRCGDLGVLVDPEDDDAAAVVGERGDVRGQPDLALVVSGVVVALEVEVVLAHGLIDEPLEMRFIQCPRLNPEDLQLAA